MELELCIGDRMTIAGRMHGDASDHTRPRILCCHGQADNAASFDSLAPLLVDAGFVVFAMDLSGHGRSSWRSTLYDPALFCLELIQTLDCLEWRSAVTLMGHSFGQAVVSMVAGAFPERVSAVVLLEGLGLWNDFHFHKSPSHALRGRIAMVTKQRTPKLFASVAEGVEARIGQLSSSPNGITISREAAQAITARGMRRLQSGMFCWSHDPALYSGTSMTRMSHDDARDFISSMPPHCLLLLAGTRTYADIPTRTEARRSAIKGLEMHTFPLESHHLHADNPKLVAPIIIRFLERAATRRSAL